MSLVQRQPVRAAGRWPWPAAALLGLSLGVLTVMSAALTTERMLLVVGAAMALCGLLILGELRRPLLALLILDSSLQIDTHLGYQARFVGTGTLNGYVVSLTTFALALLYALWLAEYLVKPGAAARLRLGQALPLLVYVGLTALSILVARDTALTLQQLFLMAQLFLLFLYVASTTRTRGDVLFIVVVLLGGLLIESGLMLQQWVASPGERVTGSFASPNNASAYISLLLAAAAAVLTARPALWLKVLAVAALSAGGLALVLTLSRGGWIASALALAIVLAALLWRGRLPIGVPLVLAALAAGIGLAFQEQISARIFGDDEGAAAIRIPLMQLAWRAIADHPLLGVGANNFIYTHQDYHVAGLSRYWVSVVHNNYLLIWAETGIVALGAFLGFLLTTLLRALRGWRQADGLLGALCLGFGAAILGHMTHMLADFFRHRPLVQLLWLIAALITAMWLIVQQEQDAGRSSEESTCTS